MQALRWGAGVLEAWLLQGERNDSALTIERLMRRQQRRARLEGGPLQDVALTLVTDLATRLECDRVSIGFRQDGRIKVQALSHSSRLVQNMNLVQAVAEAMDEAVDQNTTLCLPQDEGRTIQLRAHHKLAREFGNRHVLTVPFAPDAEARSACCSSGRTGAVSTARTLSCARAWRCWRAGCCTSGCARNGPCGARAATRCCAKRAACSARATSAASCWCWPWWRWSCSPRWRTAPIASARPPPCRAWCSAWSRRRSRAISPRPPAAPATRSGRAMCWPCWIPVRPSWSCCAGNLEVQYRRQGEEAMARGDSAAAAIAQAQARQAMAQIQFHRQQIQRSSLRAPFDGVLVSGDLSQQLGEAVKRGQELFKLSPLDGYRLWLDVEDRQIDDVAVGQTGRVALAAMPDRQIPSRSRASCRWPRSRKARRCSAWRPA